MLRNEVLVSIVCTCYNHERYIRQTLDGFVTQKTNFEFEVIIHDDASTDNSALIIREFEEKYPSIVKPIYQKENQFQKKIDIYKAFIYPRANGKYIAYCEGDDYWTDKNKLQMQIDFMEQHAEYSACVHNTRVFDLRINRVTKLISKKKEDDDISFDEAICGMSGLYHLSSLVAKKELVVESIPFSGITTVGDYPLAIHLSLKGKIRFIARTMSEYRYFSGMDSWQNKMRRGGTEMFISHKKDTIAMLQAVKQYATPEQLSAVDYAILLNQYYICEHTGDYKALRQQQFDCIYKSKNIIYKCKLFVRKYFPWVILIFNRKVS